MRYLPYLFTAPSISIRKIMKYRFFTPASLTCFLTLLTLLAPSALTRAQDNGQKVKLNGESKQAREQSLRMLDEMKAILKEQYYDPKFRGIDLDARIETAKARVKTLEYNWQMFRVLVQVLMDFDDSHTSVFFPPRNDYFQYGFVTQMIGNDCFVISVKKDSDAHMKGLEVGDQVLTYGKFTPSRPDLWKINYVLYKLDPAKTLDLNIRKPDGAEKRLAITAKTMTDKEFQAERKARKDKEKEKTGPFKCQELSKESIACKLSSFIVEKNDIDKMMKQASAYPKMILDLRGNGGGYVFIEQYLLSHFFDHEVKIADLVMRDKTDKRVTKPLGKEYYAGQLSVLVDSDSASAAEMTARVLQLEKRAAIYGDVSSGSVMTSIPVFFESLVGARTDYAILRTGMSVTVADVIMSDGSRLEHIGVIPDQILQPTATGLVKRTDPVLAYAAYKMGVTLTPEEAGKFYFMVPKEDEDIDGDAPQ
jgi:C-terminal processing protease CtpA/Prc